jgi:site-specific recombinase XerD
MEVATNKLLESVDCPNEIVNLAVNQNPEGTPLFHYWKEFERHYLREGKSEETIRNVRDVLRFISSKLGIDTIEACNTPKILREALFNAKEERNWTYVTFNSYVKNIKTYFIWLEAMEYVEQNKIRKIRKCKEELNEQYVYSDEQVKLILSHIKTRRQTRLQRHRNDFFVGLLSLTGARLCEILQLQVIDIQKFRDTYKVIIRGRKQKGRLRYYPFSSWLRDSYETYMRTRLNLRQDETNLFISSSRRTGWTQKGTRALFKRLSKELGFRVIAHAFRRYVATKLHREGYSLEYIANYLGHTRITTTQRYIERSCLLTDRGVDAMGKILN